MKIRQMHRVELDQLVEWAANEGWNPGLNDAEIFWQTDHEGFIAAELDGELIGGGSIVSYQGQYGFMGFFIIREDYRGQGLGNKLWHHRLKLLRQRLNANASIGMDGVFDMQDYYAQGGFQFAGRDLRFRGIAKTFPAHTNIVDVCLIEPSVLESYDRMHFPTPRPEFLKLWVNQENSHARAFYKEGTLQGYGVIRTCREGHKIGPLFANDASTAEALFQNLTSCVAGEPVFIDVPERNESAMKLVRKHKMTEVFGCAKMFHGDEPGLPHDQIYGVTTFELG